MMQNITFGLRSLGLSSARSFSVTPAPAMRPSLCLAATAVKDSKARLAKDKKLTSRKKEALKTKLTKEKTQLKSLEKKLRDETKKLEQKRQAREKDALAAATKPFRRLSGYTFFMKQERGNTFADSAAKWQSLSDYEKNGFSQKAESYNEEQLKIFTPKPKKPASGYALYLKENYYNDGRTIGEIGKELAAKWNQLSPNEKARYDISKSLKEDYAKKLSQWVEERLKLYNSSKA